METIENKWYTVQYNRMWNGELHISFADTSSCGMKLWSLGHARRIARGRNDCVILPVTLLLGDPIA
jgi:hypothetical protein